MTVGRGGVVGGLDESVALRVDIKDSGRAGGALVGLIVIGLGEPFVVISLFFYLSQLEICLFNRVRKLEKSRPKNARPAHTSRTSRTRPRSFNVAAWVSSLRSRSASVSVFDCSDCCNFSI